MPPSTTVYPDDVTQRAEGRGLAARGVRVLHVVGAGVLGKVQGVGDGEMN